MSVLTEKEKIVEANIGFVTFPPKRNKYNREVKSNHLTKIVERSAPTNDEQTKWSFNG